MPIQYVETYRKPTPRIYGLPKVYKPDVPLRFIVSCIASPNYQLYKHITFLTFPLAGHTSPHLNSFRHVTEMMESVHVESDELGRLLPFSNAPVGEAISVMRKRLREDATLRDRTILSPERLAELLEM